MLYNVINSYSYMYMFTQSFRIHCFSINYEYFIVRIPESLKFRGFFFIMYIHLIYEHIYIYNYGVLICYIYFIKY